MRVSIWAGVLLLAIGSRASMAAANRSPCRLHPTHPHWHVFVDSKDRFCFEYPTRYRVAPAVAGSNTDRRFLVELATKPEVAQLPIADHEDNAMIDVTAYDVPFRVDDLNRFAPTGAQDSPPRPIHAAYEVFYYYGAGGGGVDYPDAYFFWLRGRTFSIQFYGPYVGDKEPAEVTKRMEPEVLASFQRF
jgi:hypothetical protein